MLSGKHDRPWGRLEVSPVYAIRSVDRYHYYKVFETHNSYTGASDWEYQKCISIVDSNLGPIKNQKLKTIKAKKGTYPDNGIQGDFWYVRVK